MSGRWRDPTAFRADPVAEPVTRPSRRQAVSLVAVLVLVAAGITIASFVVRPERARAFDLFGGSLFLADDTAPVAVDLATAKPSVRLTHATDQVGADADRPENLSIVPLGQGGGTLLLNNRTGEFNMVDSTGFVIRHDGGVPLPGKGTGAVGVPAGSALSPDLAYIERTAPTSTSVYLIGKSTVTDNTNVRPTARGSATVEEPVRRFPGQVVGANGSLWMLSGTGPTYTLRRLSLGRAAGAGALTDRLFGRVDGPAAIGTAGTGSYMPPTSTTTGDAGSTGSTAVGVATADHITVYEPGNATARVGYTVPGQVSEILPSTNSSGRLSYLLRSSSGWYVVSVGADGHDLRGPKPVPGIPTSDDLSQPAASEGHLYTVDSSGMVRRIGLGGAASAIRGYPRTGGPLDGAYVVARGSRVLVDAPAQHDALALFTDGSHAPVVITKNDAVALNAAGDATSLSQQRIKHIRKGKPVQVKQPQAPPQSTPPPNTTTTPPPPSANCDRTPHAPAIATAVPAARSVALTWTYPRTSNVDCLPQTYVVTTTLVSGDAPGAPQPVTVEHGAQSATITGLYPNSTYAVTVTAYIGTNSATSRVEHVHTAPSGPTAPTQLQVRAGSDGKWDLSWQSCGAASADCVPSASWEVQASVCDTRGPVASLPPVDLAANQTSAAQRYVYPGSTSLLGRGLSFRVVGSTAGGVPGDISTASACVYSWKLPNAKALQLDATVPQAAQFQTTTTAALSLNLGDSPLVDVGGVGAQVTFNLTGAGTTQKHAVTYDGTQSAVSADFSGVHPGAVYTATATITPGHGTGTPVTVTAKRGTFSVRADWPTLSATAHCGQGSYLTCPLSIHISGVSSASADGEQFSLTGSTLTCNGQVTALQQDDFDPGRRDVTATYSQSQGYYGTCSIALQLVEVTPDGSPPLFGGIQSPPFTTSVDFGGPAQPGLDASDFSAAWNTSPSQSAAVVTYTGTGQKLGLATNWSTVVLGPDGANCGSSQIPPNTGHPTTVGVSQSCVNKYGTATGWTVSISYDNAIGGGGKSVSETLKGGPPSYAACDNTLMQVGNAFTATWGATAADNLPVQYAGDSSDLAGCSGWSYELFDSSGNQVCTEATVGVSKAPTATLRTSLCSEPLSDVTDFQVSWTDLDGNQQSSAMTAIAGDPPTS